MRNFLKATLSFEGEQHIDEPWYDANAQEDDQNSREVPLLLMLLGSHRSSAHKAACDWETNSCMIRLATVPDSHEGSAFSFQHIQLSVRHCQASKSSTVT